MEQVVATNFAVDKITPPRAGYIIGGKTGTAQVSINGNYSTTDFTGTYVGFIGLTIPDYVIFIQVNDPQLASDQYAGTVDGAFLFGKVTDILANGGYVN
jgi:cell division protein FtsI/penicillin-binding protein 2